MLALWLERKFSKNEILELYLNRVYFGAGAYGVEAAAQRYFGKPREADVAAGSRDARRPRQVAVAARADAAIRTARSGARRSSSPRWRMPASSPTSTRQGCDRAVPRMR